MVVAKRSQQIHVNGVVLKVKALEFAKESGF